MAVIFMPSSRILLSFRGTPRRILVDFSGAKVDPAWVHRSNYRKKVIPPKSM
jgi:hypothetical protein